MVTEKEKNIAQEYLADKLIPGVWVNSAGELFFSKELAKASDEDAEFIKKRVEKKAPDTTTQAADAQKAELKEKNLKLLSELELKKENYDVMKGLVKFFEIKTEGKSADTFIAALGQFKEILKSV